MMNALSEPHFDDSLSHFVAVLLPILGREYLENGLILRDASGRLALIANRPLPPLEQVQATAELQQRLPRYTRGAGSLLHEDQPGVSSILAQLRPWSEVVSLAPNNSIRVRFAEHRIVGQDWLNQPVAGFNSRVPMHLVFASLKGGVGRSTALAITAADLARRGYKVLVIDLDLEAPGIGSMLLGLDELPRFGMLDAYVEAGLAGLDRGFLLEMVSPSRFGRGKGLIDVVPVAGQVTLAHPTNFLAKIARAYLDHAQEDGTGKIGFLGQTQRLVAGLSAEKAYDAVLIDARAGLNETTAASLLGLGADVLLFGDHRPQTFASFRFLFAHLARFARCEEDDWLVRFRLIHAKAPEDAKLQEAFRDQAFDIFREFLYHPVVLTDETGAALLTEEGERLTVEEYSADAQEAPHYAWPILRDANYYYADPLANPDLLEPSYYLNSHRHLLDGILTLRGAAEDTVS